MEYNLDREEEKNYYDDTEEYDDRPDVVEPIELSIPQLREINIDISDSAFKFEIREGQVVIWGLVIGMLSGIFIRESFSTLFLVIMGGILGMTMGVILRPYYVVAAFRGPYLASLLFLPTLLKLVCRSGLFNYAAGGFFPTLLFIIQLAVIYFGYLVVKIFVDEARESKKHNKFHY